MKQYDNGLIILWLMFKKVVHLSKVRNNLIPHYDKHNSITSDFDFFGGNRIIAFWNLVRDICWDFTILAYIISRKFNYDYASFIFLKTSSRHFFVSYS